jgi:hypothetical protein
MVVEVAAAELDGLRERIFLEAEPDEEHIYRRTGFTDATTKLWASIRCLLRGEPRTVVRAGTRRSVSPNFRLVRRSTSARPAGWAAG